jgi:hypothetical protein
MTCGISSGTVEVNCSDLVGPALDWAVAQVEGVFVHIGDPELGDELRIFYVSGVHMPCVVKYRPSTEWRFGGPLIDKYGLSLIAPEEGIRDSHWCVVKEWCHGDVESTYPESPTALIAVCRAIVSARLGEVVSVPAELMKEISA